MSVSDTGTLFSAAGAFMTGTSALVSAIISVKVTRRRLNDECDKRVAELDKRFKAGMKLADERPRMDERWSHLE